MYSLKVPKNFVIDSTTNASSNHINEESKLYCGPGDAIIEKLKRAYGMRGDGGVLKFLVWFAGALGVVEIACILLVWCCLLKTRMGSRKAMQGYVVVGFKTFAYDELLKKATKNFRQEIGRGGYGVIYKGKLSDGRIAAIKKPKDANHHGEAEFLAEGFYKVGTNAFCFSIWFNNSVEKTVVWMANRDQPVNGKGSKFKLSKDGNLNLIDVDGTTVWSSNNINGSQGSFLQLMDSGNLVLKNSLNEIIWQSFESPTTTLLANQLFNKKISLISSKSRANYSTGFYKLYFDNDNVLRLLFDDRMATSSVYWPDISFVSWQVGRTTYNASRVASFDLYGSFESSDQLMFNASDFGLGPLRRLTLDFDGNLRMYSLNKENGLWMVTWQAFTTQCKIHGSCGANGLCMYDPKVGRKCTCLPGFKLKDHTNWRLGCEPKFDVPKNNSEVGFVTFPHVEFFGYDFVFLPNYTFEQCRDFCLQLQECKAFLIKFKAGMFDCYPKVRLLNGYQSSDFNGTLHLRVPKNIAIDNSSIMSPNDIIEDSKFLCSSISNVTVLKRNYQTSRHGAQLKFLVWFASSLGVVEMACILLVWFCLLRNESQKAMMQGYYTLLVGFKRFTYDELRKATRNFRQEIGRGGYGIIYKGKLSDGRIAAIKKLNDASHHGEAEFLAEVSTIGGLNHMNLIEMWGFCAEGKQRLLVFEYMENKSLAENLFLNSLDWSKRYEIALGTARGLAYLHEECMEWILHCDVKPQNILLDANYQPKVADFGLSKLLNRSGANNSSFSRIRGTRGYMAPEWITNLPITSKVDVYSYGVVVLEMVTGKNPTVIDLVTWVREEKYESPTLESWIEKIADSQMEGNYNMEKMQSLAVVALQCVKEDKDVRPTMREVVEILQGHHNDLSII